MQGIDILSRVPVGDMGDMTTTWSLSEASQRTGWLLRDRVWKVFYFD